MSLDLNKFKVYVVGGYVRDRLLGRDPKDHDYVVVGATPSDMTAAGFSQVGAAFPVFLHPTSGDEYALARKERKVGVGYHGFECVFDPTVTIEEDLFRRDLTINAMARQVLGWNAEGHATLSDEIVDPYNGRADLKAGILRAVSTCFVEDPVRILRTARFAARYGFDVDPYTVQLMGDVAHELNDVPQERIWAEFEKGLMEKFPWLMFELLNECGATNEPALRPYRDAVTQVMTHFTDDTPLDVRFVVAARGFKGTDYELCRIPVELARVSDAFNTDFVELIMYATRDAATRLSTLTAFRAITDDAKLFKCMTVVSLYTNAVGVGAPEAWRDTVSLMKQDLAQIHTVDAAAIAATCKNGLEIKQKLFEARVAAMGS